MTRVEERKHGKYNSIRNGRNSIEMTSQNIKSALSSSDEGILPCTILVQHELLGASNAPSNIDGIKSNQINNGHEIGVHLNDEAINKTSCNRNVDKQNYSKATISDNNANIKIDAHELEMLQLACDEYKIAEALAKATALTSTIQLKQRLLARKLELERHENDGHRRGSAKECDLEEYEPPRDILLYLVR